MRKLWVDHVTWTRLFIVSAAADLPDKSATTQRLLQNQTDIGAAIATIYGKAAGDKLTSLLKDHILIAADLVGAAKAGQTARVDSLNRKWGANADDIAVFLNSANPKHWPTATLKSLMHTHLDQTLAEATHQLKGDYTASVKDYDAIGDPPMRWAERFDLSNWGFFSAFSGPSASVVQPSHAKHRHWRCSGVGAIWLYSGTSE